MSAILEVKNLVVRRDGHEILKIDHLDIDESKVLAVIGPNGAGKSTLLLILGRLLTPDEGQVIYRDQLLKRQGDLTYRRRIGLVLQEPLLLDISVFDNVAAGLRYRQLPRGEIEKRVAEWLSRLGVSHLRDRPARKLSGGEAQRVSLARAFAIQPELLLLDEPFSALDSPTRARLLEDLQTLLVETSVTTVFVTHDLDEALFLGERVAILLGGSLRQCGKPQMVFSAPADEDVATFVGVETILVGEVVSAKEGQVSVASNGWKIDAIGSVAPGRPVFICLRPEDVTLWPGKITPVSSARNRIGGKIVHMTPKGPLVRVEVDCGFPLIALVTRASANEMGFYETQEITATFKASAVHLIPR